jgi:hypothetical protein
MVLFLGSFITGCNAYTAPASTATGATVTSTPTTTTETILTYQTTPGGIEYFTGTDGEMKFVERRDNDVRVLAPVNISDADMEFYLDRACKANDFVAGFFDRESRLPQLVIVSYDGKRWTAINNPGKSYGWIPSVFPWNITYFAVGNHDGVVHVITNNWVNAYLSTKEPAQDFFAYYLGNAAAFAESGGTLENFNLKNASTVLNHELYYGTSSVLTAEALAAMGLSTEDSVTWSFGFQLNLEENDKLGYAQIKHLAELLADKANPGDIIGAEDYLAAEQALLSGLSTAPNP